MKRNLIFNKYYRNLREGTFKKLEIQEFMEVYIKFKRLRIQYKLLKIAECLEKITFPTLDVPIIRIFYKVIGFYTLENLRFDYVAY